LVYSALIGQMTQSVVIGLLCSDWSDGPVCCDWLQICYKATEAGCKTGLTDDSFQAVQNRFFVLGDNKPLSG